MSCYITTDAASGMQTRHYTGDVTINLTSATTGAGYVPPVCTMKSASHGVTEPGTLALIVIGVRGGEASLPRPA